MTANWSDSAEIGVSSGPHSESSAQYMDRVLALLKMGGHPHDKEPPA
jgi:hypothetical protein